MHFCFLEKAFLNRPFIRNHYFAWNYSTYMLLNNLTRLLNLYANSNLTRQLVPWRKNLEKNEEQDNYTKQWVRKHIINYNMEANIKLMKIEGIVSWLLLLLHKIMPAFLSTEDRISKTQALHTRASVFSSTIRMVTIKKS